ncbi:hypothetical protein HY949_04390 [Candidatus Gottesmanbacteria bacterium]|nr:hypothetical protein [Candidatus Gottesmanbacteria bacterium]
MIRSLGKKVVLGLHARTGSLEWIVMKLPDIFNRLAKKTPAVEEAYLSLVLESGIVEAAVWTLPRSTSPQVGEKTSESVEIDSWEARLAGCDRAIARLADASGRDDFEKVVLGLPVSMLTGEDDIDHASRSGIKKLTEELELTPIGFVPIHQAIIHAIRQEEGVPPSAILVEIGLKESMMILYKVGTEVGRVSIPSDDLVPGLERALKGFKDLEVLPSRILLYGARQDDLEGFARDLFKHPWPTRANFLHYPKIEILLTLTLAGAVSLAGASELGSHMMDENMHEVEDATQSKFVPSKQRQDVHQDRKKESDESIRSKSDEERAVVEEEGEQIQDSQGLGITQEQNDQDATEGELTPDTNNGEVPIEQEIALHDVKAGIPREETEGDRGGQEDQNVVEVSPESLGFAQNTDILEHPVVRHPGEDREVRESAQNDDIQGTRRGEAIKAILSRFVSRVNVPKFHSSVLPKPILLVGIVLAILVGGGGWFTYWVLPKATVVVYQVPAVVSRSGTVTVNPTATIVDASNNIVPGRKQEKSVTGDKTIAVTGQKDVGDPARGTVTVYNKTLSQKQLKKGTVLSSGILSFMLDTDIAVASASESLASGSVTYGKASAPITAVKLGTASNLPANTEFSIKDTPASVMVARNDAALTGGTSKVVTVVSRADQAALIEGLTKDLVQKAKTELAGSVSGGEQLIDETVKTAVSNKKFDTELDQETRELHGTITVAMGGISYRDEDIAALFADQLAGSVPDGYALTKTGARIQASQAKVQKDGSIGLTIQYDGQALPVFDPAGIRISLAGKTPSQAEGILKTVKGAGGFEVKQITGSLWGTYFPKNAQNITIIVAVLE